jgi:glutamate--cysteine ligase
LFGATPAASATSLPEKLPSFLQKGKDDTLFGEWTTSLRMSGFGYNNPIQRTIKVRFDNLQTYAEDLLEATKTPYLKYMEIGEFENGKRIQLNTNLLQIENEYYSPIRLKQVAGQLERQLDALTARGVAYVEVRIVDLNPFFANAIEPNLLPFLDVFLTYCAFESEACLTDIERGEFHQNLKNIALFGRKPELALLCRGKEIPLKAWLMSLYEDLLRVAKCMDSQSDEKIFQIAVKAQCAKIENSTLTPSAQVLSLLNEDSYHDAMLRLAKSHRDFWLGSPPDAEFSTLFDEEGKASIRAEKQLVEQSTGSFEDYLADYLK